MSNADKSKVKQGVNFGNDLTIFISPARSEWNVILISFILWVWNQDEEKRCQKPGDK
jgi:hypothetical protein